MTAGSVRCIFCAVSIILWPAGANVSGPGLELMLSRGCRRTRDGRFVKHKTEERRLTRKLAALRQVACRFMQASLATWR